ncbi:hypothetical protein [Nostoc sp. WHI]|uniref:hypothetical protein n=1 Tax=Nostoc sp. WHI TaxID=2650611 RepID=UPI001E5F4BF9|nr:hypothetical protein [Nostoc sp. WHI]
MHPIEFKKKWQLSYDDLALVLGYQSDYTVRSWNMNGRHKRKEVKKLSMSLVVFLMRSGQRRGNL